jgi:hypothetical protein
MRPTIFCEAHFVYFELTARAFAFAPFVAEPHAQAAHAAREQQERVAFRHVGGSWRFIRAAIAASALGARDAAFIGGRAAAVDSAVNGGIASKESHRLFASAVVRQGSEQAGLGRVVLIAGTAEVAGVVTADVAAR